jgi:hypothetical protein
MFNIRGIFVFHSGAPTLAFKAKPLPDCYAAPLPLEKGKGWGWGSQVQFFFLALQQ